MLFAAEAIDELRTIGDIIRWGSSRFSEALLDFGHGTDNALDEAFSLVCHTLHLPHDIPPYMLSTRLTKAERRKAINLIVERVSTRKPAAYLTNEAWFAGLAFYVDERVLVPRSPIAELIKARFEPWIDPNQVKNILDLCTGSGCIAIVCTIAFEGARIDASDISAPALDVAKQNIVKHQVQKTVKLIESDLFNNIDATEKKYDIIVSNPPYIDAEAMAALSEEFRYEPASALAAGADGLDIVKRILADAAAYLSPEGILVVEVGNSDISLVDQFPDMPFVWPDFEHGGHGVFVLNKQQIDDSTNINKSYFKEQQ